MRLLLYILCLLFIGKTGLAQPAKPVQKPKPKTTTTPLPPLQALRLDVLYRTDSTSTKVKIDQLTDTDVVYSESGAPTVKKTLPRTAVWKIVFRDGSIEIITPPGGKTADTDQPVSPKKTTAAPAPPAEAPLSPSSSAAPSPAAGPSASYKDADSFARVHLTVGPEVALFSTTKRWGNDLSGLGMNQNVGASVRLDFRLIKAVAMSFTGGYNQWKLVRNYLQSGTEKYDETIKLTRIPIQGGLKLYLGDNLYLMPEGGINLLSSEVTTSGNHPVPTSTKSSSTPITYGASLGYEIRLGALLVELSGRYQILDVKNLSFGGISPALTEKVSFGSVRVGIGFNALRK